MPVIVHAARELELVRAVFDAITGLSTRADLPRG
jgi:hypothetical protein